ncbi:MAG: hypothetical protein QM781_00415 [Chitinophagaceae bacterium]
MQHWTVSIHAHHLSSLGNLRAISSLQVAICGDELWLRAQEPAMEMPEAVKGLPLIRYGRLDALNNFFDRDAITPTLQVPLLDWQMLTQFLAVDWPVSALPAQVKEGVSIQLMRSAATQPPVALLTTLSHWKEFGDQAAGVRLEPLRFALSGNTLVLVTGSPLPNIPGTEYWSDSGLWLPAGFVFASKASADLFRSKWLMEDHIILWQENGNWSDIPLSFFKPATRSAIRFSAGIPAQ